MNYDLTTLTGPELVAAYNTITISSVKRFASRATGMDKLKRALEEATPAEVKSLKASDKEVWKIITAKAEAAPEKEAKKKLSDEVKHYNLRCPEDGYMLKTNKLCLDWARPKCPVCDSKMLTAQERKELKDAG